MELAEFPIRLENCFTTISDQELTGLVKDSDQYKKEYEALKRKVSDLEESMNFLEQLKLMTYNQYSRP